MKTARLVLATLWLLSAPLAAQPTLTLAHDWRLQRAARVSVAPEVLSKPGYQPSGWLKTDVPSTVLAAQVAAGAVPDPYYGANLRALPGVAYKVGQNFNELEIPNSSPYHGSWWYRTEFSAPAAWSGRTQWLQFDGINYRANVWLNGHRIAAAERTAGTYRTFEFNVTGALRPGAKNVLAVETFAPRQHDLAVNWVDWNPMPPDKDMGLWRPVRLTTSGVVALRHATVSTHFVDGLHEADLTVETDVVNTSPRPVSAMLKGRIGTAHFSRTVTLAPQQTTTVRFWPEQCPALRVQDPEVWWPYGLGTPHLETLDMDAQVQGQTSDTARVRFGIREITSELTPDQARLFKVNGRPLLVRGGGWAPDMLLRQSPSRLRDEFAYVRHLGLNTIRLEGKMESDDFFNLADEQGILVMAGWCCCDIWEEWDKWGPEQHRVAAESLRSQLLRLRSHPSLLVWLYGSDGPPPPPVEKEYLRVLEGTQWPNPWLSSASAEATPGAGASGVKMTGPYEYVPPSYWSNPVALTLQYGGAFAFNTETSPGASIPTEDSLSRFLPKDHRWPIDDVWKLHCGGNEFATLDRYNQAMTAMYGAPADLHDYVRKGQAMAYDAERAMFEAYGRNKYKATGVVQWMLNNAWPSTYWHLYDYYLETGGAYFGVRKANEPLHVQYGYPDRAVVVVNNRYAPQAGLQVQADVFDADLKPLFSHKQALDVAADSAVTVFTLPETHDFAFVRLRLTNAVGRILSANDYWLPAQASTFDWSKTTFFYTPSPQFEDVTALQHLPPVELQASVEKPDPHRIRVTVSNPGPHLAFQVVARLLDDTGHSIEPVLWDDNYVTLFPGETRTLEARCQRTAFRVDVRGWNADPVKVSGQ